MVQSCRNTCPALCGVLFSDAEGSIPPLLSDQAHTPTYHWNLPWKVTKIEIKIFFEGISEKKNFTACPDRNGTYMPSFSHLGCAQVSKVQPGEEEVEDYMAKLIFLWIKFYFQIRSIWIFYTIFRIVWTMFPESFSSIVQISVALHYSGCTQGPHWP